MRQFVKNHRRLQVLGLVLGLTLILMGFQNCAQDVKFSSMGSELELNGNGGSNPLELTGALTINDGALATNNTIVNLKITAKNAVQMALASGDCPAETAEFKDLEFTKSWNLLDKDGDSSVYLRLKSANSEVSPCLSASIILDRMAPSLEFNKVPLKFSPINEASFLLSSQDALSGIKEIYCRSKESPAFVLCQNSLELSSLDEGERSLLAYSVDKAGNTSEIIEYSWIVDTKPPTVSILSPVPPSLVTNGSAIIYFEGVDVDGSGIASYNCRINSVAIPNCTSPTTLNALPDGNYSFFVKAKDKAGWESPEVTANFVADSKASGKFDIIGITGGGDTKIDNYLSSNASPRIHFTRSDGAQKYVANIANANGVTLCGPVEVNGTDLSATVAQCNLIDGQRYLAKLTSIRNNLTTLATDYSFVADYSGPIIRLGSVASSDENKTAKIEFDVTDSGSGLRSVTCYKSYAGNIAQSDCLDKTAIEYSNLPVGEHHFYISAEDNLSHSSTSITVNISIKNVVCDPFNVTSEGLCKKGLKANLYYASSADRALGTSALNSRYSTVDKLVEMGIKSNSVLFLGSLDVSARSFDKGFTTTDNALLKDDQGNKLDEWFALDMESVLKLEDTATSADEGYYQLMLISDDGAYLKIDTANNGNYRLLVNNDGVHSTKVGCANSGDVVQLTKSSRLPIQVRYYQGPRTHIAVSLFWRKVTQPSAARSQYCGFSSASTSEVNGWGDATGTGDYYSRIRNEGFKPLNPGNFILKENL